MERKVMARDFSKAIACPYDMCIFKMHTLQSIHRKKEVRKCVFFFSPPFTVLITMVPKCLFVRFA